MDEFYKDILYKILHNVKLNGNVDIGQLALISHVQDAFGIPNDRHQLLLADAETRTPPKMMLNIEIVEAKNVNKSDGKGLGVTLYLLSNKKQRFITSVRIETVNPSWREHFSLPISDTPAEEILCIKVRNIDVPKTLQKKIKVVKGLKNFIKEIAGATSTGKNKKELIGRVTIPLKAVCSSGMTMWYSLDNKRKSGKQGTIMVKTSFSSEKDPRVAIKEHRDLLWILLMHELNNSKVAPYWWSGNFCLLADAIIQQHAALCGLSRIDNFLAQWTVFCAVHVEHPLNFGLFHRILCQLVEPLQCKIICEDEVKLFWDGARKLLPSCFNVIRNFREENEDDVVNVKKLTEILKVLFTHTVLETPASVDLFPKNIYSWIERTDDQPVNDMIQVLRQGIIDSAATWFSNLLNDEERMDTSHDGRLNNLIRVVDLVKTDLISAVKYYNAVYEEVIDFPYARTLFMLYQVRVTDVVKPEVLNVCENLRQIRYDEEYWELVTLEKKNGTKDKIVSVQVPGETFDTGTTMFKLYHVLQSFLELGESLYPRKRSEMTISKFHWWFFGRVGQWLEIVVHTVFKHIEMAVLMDKLVPECETVKYTSSAVDTIAIFNQIKVFWQQLAWPDIEGSYIFIAKVIDETCRCCVFYANNMSAKLDSMDEALAEDETEFAVTDEWCFAINNIDYVKKKLHPFVARLGFDEIVNRLSEFITPAEAQRYKDTLTNVIESAIDNIHDKIFELVNNIIKMMISKISQLLLKDAKSKKDLSYGSSRAIIYLQDNFDVLEKSLNGEIFSWALDVLWDHLCHLFYQLIDKNLQKKRPPSFYSNLQIVLKEMTSSFYKCDLETNYTIQTVKHLLTLHGATTDHLIYQFLIEKWKEQDGLSESPFGTLTVRALFTDISIKIEVLNARNLLPPHPKDSLNSYVRIKLFPVDSFSKTFRPKTKTHNDNRFPLYDEIFTIELSPEQRKCKEGVIIFNVKHCGMWKISKTYIGDAVLPFNEVATSAANLETVPQVHLKLSRTSNLDGDLAKTLKTREDDKQASDFINQEKLKNVDYEKNCQE